MRVLFCVAAICAAAVWIDGAASVGMIFYAARRGDGAGCSRAKTRGGSVGGD